MASLKGNKDKIEKEQEVLEDYLEAQEYINQSDLPEKIKETIDKPAIQQKLILEQTFFCAITPSLRLNYVMKVYRLVTDGGSLVGLLFNRTFDFGAWHFNACSH